MHKLQNTIKLPKIEEYGLKNQPYLSPSKDKLPAFPGVLNSAKKGNKLIAHIDPEAQPELPRALRGFSSDKAIAFGANKDESYFMNHNLKQNWLLKKMEAQRESMSKKPQFISLSPKNDSYYNATKASLINGNSTTNSVLQKDPAGLRKKILADENNSISKSVDMGSKNPKGKFNISNEVGKKSSLQVDTNTVDEPKKLSPSSDKHGFSAGALLKPSIHPRDRMKLPGINSTSDGFEPIEKTTVQVNLDLLYKISQKIAGIYENIEHRPTLISNLKEYLELVDAEEAIQVEAIFFDTRMRRNLKTYIMLEKSSAYTLLSLVTDDPKDSNETSIRNICSYVYSNFLNFLETLCGRLDLLPKYKDTADLDKLRQVYKKKPMELEKSFGIEQTNKMLLKALRINMKQTLAKRADKIPRVDLLLEKVEFGLMLSYNDELKNIFSDLIATQKLNLASNGMSSETTVHTEPNTATKKKPSKPEKAKTVTPMRVANGEFSPSKKAAEFHLPPPVPKFGQEDKPIYTLVLDMDETLIHFEEVGGKGRFFVRPYAEKFLKELSELWEVVIFTAGVKEYADAVLNILDPNGYISHRLYRHHTTIKPATMSVIKDLTKIGRDLSKTLIVDNAPENFKLQQDNGIEIISWYNDPYDTELLDMMPFLKDLVNNQVEDVRKPNRKFKEKRKHRRN